MTKLNKIELVKCKKSEVTGDKKNYTYNSFSRYDFSNVIFKNVDFVYGLYRGCSFKNATFINCNMFSSYFKFCNFDNARFVNCDMPEIGFESSDFEHTSFLNCFIGGFFAEDISFKSCSFVDCSINNSELKNVSFRKGTKLENISFLNLKWDNVGIERSCLIDNVKFKVLYMRNFHLINIRDDDYYINTYFFEKSERCDFFKEQTQEFLEEYKKIRAEHIKEYGLEDWYHELLTNRTY